jgi:hypothetical protein
MIVPCRLGNAGGLSPLGAVVEGAEGHVAYCRAAVCLAARDSVSYRRR